MIRRLIAIGLVLSVWCVRSAGAQRSADDSAKVATVRRILVLTDVAGIMEHAIEALLPAQRAANPTIPPAFWDAFAAHARQDVPGLVDSLVPIYTSRFTLAELRQLEQFYLSPVGKHLAASQPGIIQESQQIGQRWGAALGKRVADSLQIH